MLKKIQFLIFINLLLTSTIYSKANYIPAQLAQLRQTHICNQCDLSGATLGVYTANDLSHAQLKSAILDYANKSDNFCNLNMDNSDFTGARLINSNFISLKAGSSLFDNANLQGANFEFANLSGSSFKNCNLTNVDFKGATLTSSNFSGANLTGADLARADLLRSNVSKEQLASAASLSGTILPDGSVCNDVGTCKLD